VYSTCLFCNKRFGGNEVVEPFPIGRRIAFDQAKGRLWVVCRYCERWNLTPFEERWEALEDCERRFRDAKMRVSSDNIGLARLNEGLELVRIGKPLRPEFAAWRYGDQFGRRRRRAIASGVGIGALTAAAIVGGAGVGLLAGGGWWVYEVVAHAARGIGRRRLIARVPLEDGSTLTVRRRDLEWVRLVPGSGSADLRMEFWHPSHGDIVVREEYAVNAASLIIPSINRSGASQRKVQAAVRQIEDFPDPVRYLHRAAAQADQQVEDLAKWTPHHARRKTGTLQRLPLETRLAVEMAVNEENERMALEGELALLELDWKEAEEVAAIADSLALPADVEDGFERLKRKAVDRDAGTP
jgi:hypothetical protein